MADSTDICNVLVGLISAQLYPNGTAQPSLVSGVAGIRVEAGWPVPEQLDIDLANTVRQVPAPICAVSVWPLPAERNTTRYLEQWQTATVNTPTLTLVASGQTVTVGGFVPPISNPHNAVIFVNGRPYVYAVQPSDSLSGIATALAAQINLVVSGTSSTGSVVNFPPGAKLGAVRIGVSGQSVIEISRQEKQFQIIIWADSPTNRTAIGRLIDSSLKALSFISLPDFSAGRIRSVGQREYDTLQKQAIYRRDLIYTVEYATTQTMTATQITQEVLNVSVDFSGLPPAQPAVTVNL